MPPVEGATVQPGLTVAVLAEEKGLPADWLRSTFELYDLPNYNGQRAVAILYRDENDQLIATRYRIAMSGDRFRWKRNDSPSLYGLWRLDDIRRAGWVVLVEGESDAWTAWHHDVPALGVPGKSIWKLEWAALLSDLEVFVWQEPDAEDFAARIGATIPALRVIAAPNAYKDLSAAHIAGEDVSSLIDALRQEAFPIADVLDEQRRELMATAKRAAAPILAAPDPLPIIEQGLRSLGYGGDLAPATITYLAATTRLLAVRPGTMLAHLLLIGPASAGKSYTVGVVLRLLPPAAYAVIDAGSPRALIYDPEDYQHRALIFAEADSIPAGEDNPAASAIRNLLQDNRLHYKTTIKDPQTGEFTTQTIEKPGPTVMLTTSTRSLGHQLSTRLFALDVPDDANQMRAALAAQGALEEDGSPEPDATLIAFQGYLQAAAPWDVVVPFARKLGDLIGTTHTANRVLRDFQRLLSLVKAVTILRHRHRHRDGQGRLVADIEDYATVRELVGPIYSATVAGGAQVVRNTVGAVATLTAAKEEPSALDVANHLGVHKATASRHINKAIAEGWLINLEEKRSRPYRLKLGDPLPDTVGLPSQEALAAGGYTVAGSTDGNTPLPSTSVKRKHLGETSVRQQALATEPVLRAEEQEREY